MTRDHRADVFVGAIIEGPSTWTVRPVAEIFYENEFGRMATVSGLVGLIYRVSDNLSFDVGVRHASTNGRPVNEIRAGEVPMHAPSFIVRAESKSAVATLTLRTAEQAIRTAQDVRLGAEVVPSRRRVARAIASTSSLPLDRRLLEAVRQP